MATQTDLRNKVLQLLGVKGAGQSVNAADAVIVEDAYSFIHEDLVHRNIIWWGLNDEIPARAMLWLAVIVANHVVLDFGAEPNLTATLRTDYAGAERQLRILRAERDDLDERPVDY